MLLISIQPNTPHLCSCVCVCVIALKLLQMLRPFHEVMTFYQHRAFCWELKNVTQRVNLFLELQCIGVDILLLDERCIPSKRNGESNHFLILRDRQQHQII